MWHRLLIGALVTALACLAMGGVAEAETLIATTPPPTAVRSWGGVAAFSLYDGATQAYRLAISRNGAAPELPVAAAQLGPFDVDVGPDQNGSPTLVYSRCAMQTLTRRRGCDLYRYSLTDGKESRIAAASSRNASEVAPTIWRGQIAWVRISDIKKTRRPPVYARQLAAPSSKPSVHLVRFRLRDCGGDGCNIDELELRGLKLAVLYRHPGPVCGSGRILLGTVGGRPVRIADTTCGLNGQTFVGLSFDAGNLYFAHFCVAEPIGCGQRVGAFRYSLRTRRYSLARFGRRLTGFSYDRGQKAFEVLAPDTPRGYCGNSVEEAPQPGPAPDCQIVLTDPLTFARTRPLR
jgi:hypothetical protein